MAKQESEQGPLTKRFEFYVRRRQFEYGGMDPDGDAANVPDNRLFRAINARLKAGTVVPRGGLDNAVSGAIQSGACITGGRTFQISTPLRLYVLASGCLGVSAGTGYSVSWADTEQSTIFTSGVYYRGNTAGLVGAVYNGDIYLGEGNRLRKLQAITQDYSVAPLSIAGSSQDIPLKRFEGYTRISWMCEFDSKLFIALDNGVGASKIVAYDGTEFVDDLTGINVVTGMFVWRDKLIAGYAGAPNEIRLRAVGDAPGTWATATPGAGTVSLFNTGASLRGTAYWATGASGDIWSYDGTTLQIAQTIGGGATISAVALFNGLLYFCDSNSANNGRIGFYDGTTWTATHKNVAATKSLIGLVSYRGDLWVIGSSNVTLYRSPGTNTAGTYTTVSGVGTAMATATYAFLG